jgi:hypothetical protein
MFAIKCIYGPLGIAEQGVVWYMHQMDGRANWMHGVQELKFAAAGCWWRFEVVWDFHVIAESDFALIALGRSWEISLQVLW